MNDIINKHIFIHSLVKDHYGMDKGEESVRCSL